MTRKDKTNFPKEINNFKKGHLSQSSNQEIDNIRYNKGNKFYKRQISLIRISNIIYIIILLLIIQSNEDISLSLKSQYSYITLKINKKGTSWVYNGGYYPVYDRRAPKPDEIYINGVNRTQISCSFTFNETNNTIKLIYLKDVTITNFMFYDCVDIIEIDFSNFDGSKVTNMTYMFGRCTSLKFVDLSNFNGSLAQDTILMFFKCTSLQSVNLTNFDISRAVNISKMFSECTSLIALDLSAINANEIREMTYVFHNCKSLSVIDLTNFNTSKARNMSYMFYGCKSLPYLNLSSFDTSQVIDMQGMFYKCSILNNLDLSNFDTSRVINMGNMFYFCEQLNNLNISNFITSQVKNMTGLFSGCYKLESLNLSNFNTSQVITFSRMFFFCFSLKSLYIFNFDTSKAIDIESMFNGCHKLTSLNVSNFDTSKVEIMADVYKECYILTSLDLSNFNTSNVKTMAGLFSSCQLLNSMDLNNFDTSKVTDMNCMFYGCKNITFLNISNFDTSQVMDMRYMFYFCEKFNSINISNFITTKVLDMSGMFRNCKILSSLNISHFDTSQVADMSYMFSGCENIPSFNLINFNTSKVNNMEYMFNNCSLLTSLDLFNFDTHNVKYMNNMFSNCIKLTSLNLSNFDTSNVKSMPYMFSNCIKLTSLNLINFKTSQINDMSFMFFNCTNLTSLDLYNFNTSEVTNMKSMFEKCKNLNSLNVSNFNTKKVTNMEKMFYGCESINYLDLSNFNQTGIKDMNYMFQVCKSLQFINLEKFRIDINVYYVFDNNIPTNSIICSKYLIWGNLLKGENITINCFKDEINNKENQCFKRYLRYNNKFTCSICGDNYYLIYNDSKNNNTYFNCYKTINGYYLNKDTEDAAFKPCYSKCKTCDKEGNDSYHQCIECNDGYISGIKYDNYSNCYNEPLFENKSEYLSDNNFYEFNTDLQKESEINYLSNETDESQTKIEKNNITEIISYLLNISNYLNADNDTKKNNTEIYQEYELIKLNDTQSNIKNEHQSNIAENDETDNFIIIQSDSPKNNDNSNDVEKSNEINQMAKTQKILIENNSTDMQNKSENVEKIKQYLINKLNTLLNSSFSEDIEMDLEKKILLTLTTTSLQKENQNKNKTTIDLKECEDKLKDFYKISKNESLYIIKIDIKEEGMKIPKIEYEVYYPLYSNNISKLNLSICEKTKIDILIPISINDDIEKYNISSDYYNDFCSLATSINGTDITLSDRKQEFMNNNMSLCEENCELTEYNYNTQKAKCSCDVKINITLFENIKFDKQRFFDNFIKVKNIININVVKCYKIAFDKNNIKKNIGFFIFLFLILIYLITLLIFRFKSFYRLKRNINKFANYYNPQKDIKNDNNDIYSQKEDNQDSILRLKNNENIKIIKNSRDLNKLNLNLKINQYKEEDIKNNDIFNMESKNENNIQTQKKLKYKEFELNLLDYNTSLIYDNRTYFQYYISLLKYNHLIVFSFFNITDYNSRIIKMFLFFFFFSIYLTVNALFFNDSTMHKIYEDAGIFNYIYHIPIIIYSSLISGIINAILKQLALTQKNIIKIKHLKKKDTFKKESKNVLNRLNIKFILFFILAFILLLVCGIYIICFCGIYKNTQIILIKDTFISFALSMVYPFGKYLIPGIFRIHALNSKNNDNSYSYKISLLLQMI